MSLADDLDQHLIGDEVDLTPPQLGDIEHVDRLLRGVAWRRKRLADCRALVDAKRAELDEWLADQETKFSTEFHEDVLAQYHRARLADDPKAKTISLPSGTLVARAGQPRWSIDAEQFVPWATAHAPDLLRTKVEPALSEAKKALGVDGTNAVDADGSVVPGVVVEPAQVNLSIKVGDE